VRSHLLLGKVRHRRVRPARHDLEHDVWYFALDLDELDEIARRPRLVARNRRAALSFRDADHLPTPARGLPTEIRAHLRAGGLDLDGGRIILVTNLRVFGYVFNPASFYLCRDVDGRLAAVVVEVHNTYGERHLYTLRPQRDGAMGNAMSASMDKGFFVSPFISLDGRYSVTVRDDADALAIGINLRQDGQPLLSTSLSVRRVPLNTRSLVRLLLRYPLITQRTTALIHWHALRLWLKRVPFIRYRAGSEPGIAAHGAGR
jgi:DUF1365 family protein